VSARRLFTVDFRQIDQTVRAGEHRIGRGQRDPVRHHGNDNVWPDTATGKVKWRWTPGDVAVLNFGIVANRGSHSATARLRADH
jgi:hypothetical protein